MADDQEKTEAATPRRRDETRRRGQFARSREATAAVTLVGGGLLLLGWGPGLIARLREYAVGALGQLPGGAFSALEGTARVRALMVHTATMVGPIVIGLLLLAFVMQAVQVGGLQVYVERLQFRFDAFNPVRGLKRLFSLRSVVQLVVSLAKVAVVAATLYLSVRSRIIGFGGLADRPAFDALREILEVVLLLVLSVGLVELVIGAFDYFYQRWQHEKDIRMSKQEVKEELKAHEGNQQVRARIRSIQRRFAQSRMMQALPEASVVVANPTHYSVALKYEKERMPAPRVVAKGRDLIALRIREIAREHGIPIVEDPPLAQALYRDVELGDMIPPRFYRAVAAVLAYVMRRGRIAALV
ncbi:MAG: flagellar biosynthesis protein FlhB [Planctomycetota bacterium]